MTSTIPIKFTLSFTCNIDPTHFELPDKTEEKGSLINLIQAELQEDPELIFNHYSNAVNIDPVLIQ